MIVFLSAYPALAGVLLFAAVGKVRDVRGFARSIGNYRILPRRLTIPAAAVTVAAELVAAVLLVVPATRRWGAATAAVLFAAFLVAMATAVRRGLRIDCGCFGGPDSSDLVGPGTMTRTGLLLALAVPAAVAGTSAFSPVHLVLSALLLCLVMVTSEVVKALAEPAGAGG
ncbi:MauE/DoxX family redox-associated membrane protein [Sphaerisporangium fuscum]|uniref:MauE/DoxX family redox-associated membrane protein n=1 Tax=Sphaerisporangium fuscum TaxID=2835868 RepID=UPI001BDCDE2B|nr:MauE/DoxX family redox-associated membrane protein [Sphaerisporangium fuscum]